MKPASNPALILALAVVLTPTVALAAWRDEVVRTEQRAVNVPAGGAVRIDHRIGQVKVRGHQRNDLVAAATFRVSAKDKASAEAFSRAMRLEVTTAGTTVHVRINMPEWNGRMSDAGFAVDLDVAVPERAPLHVENRFGDTSVTRVKAPLIVSSGNGKILVVDVEASATIKNRFGGIEVSRVSGDLDVENANGDTTAQSVNGATTVRSRFGGVRLDDIGGHARIDGTNGAISARDVRGGATITTAFGAVTLERITGAVSVTGTNGDIRLAGVDGQTTVSSRFGRVILRDIAGTLTANSSNGDIDAGMAPGGCHPVSLESRFGRLLMLTGGGGYALDASAKFGRIDTDVQVQTTDTRASRPGNQQRVTGQIGDGRCPLVLVTNNGDILVRGGTAPAPRDADGYRRPAVAPRAPQAPRPPRAPGSTPLPAPAPAR